MHDQTVIDVSKWEIDEDFTPFPQGSKPKRALICPSPKPNDFLIEGHRYMFKISKGWRIHQHWSEVLAYRLAHLTRVPAAPCYIAMDTRRDEVGVLVEFFYGYPGCGVPARVLWGADLLRRSIADYDDDQDGYHTIWNVLRVLRLYRVHNHVPAWGRVIAFDALIGNTDRHPENWGLLAIRQQQNWQFELAPCFDHGTSLAYGMAEDRLEIEIASERIARQISRGAHHVHWSEQNQARSHFVLCGMYRKRYSKADAAMRSVLNVPIPNSKNLCNTSADSICLMDVSQIGEPRIGPSHRCSPCRIETGTRRTLMTEHVIKDICEPCRLLLAWQSPDLHDERTRFAVGELLREGDGYVLRYLSNEDARLARELGYRGYPAFRLDQQEHRHGVLAAFLRRVPPRSRADFEDYKTHFRLGKNTQISDFAMLAYTEAKLPSDGFSLVNTFEGVCGPCEFLLEVAGYRHYVENLPLLRFGERADLVPEPTNPKDPDAIAIQVNGQTIGYINRLQTGAFHRWMKAGEVTAEIDQINGSSDRPRAFIFVWVWPNKSMAA